MRSQPTVALPYIVTQSECAASATAALKRFECVIAHSVMNASTIDTPANRKAMGEAKAASWVSPDDIADATRYLCSDKSRSVYGATLEVFAKA